MSLACEFQATVCQFCRGLSHVSHSCECRTSILKIFMCRELVAKFLNRFKKFMQMFSSKYFARLSRDCRNNENENKPHSRESRETLSRMSRDCRVTDIRTTFVRVSHECRENFQVSQSSLELFAKVLNMFKFSFFILVSNVCNLRIGIVHYNSTNA